MPEQTERRQYQKRVPSKQIAIKDINKDLQRIAIVGTVVNRNDTVLSFLLDDGTGTVNVIVNDADKFSQVKDGQIVRVLGRIWGEGEDIEVQGDLIQDFSELDLTIFKQVFSNQ